MAMVYEVWDTLTANRIGAFPTDDEARALLFDVLRVNGAGVVQDMAVLRWDMDTPDDEPELVLEGADFLAQRRIPARVRRRRRVGRSPGQAARRHI